MSNVTAHAKHGFIKEQFSTRLACGNARQPVKEFVYLSPTNYVGDDQIEFKENGRRTFLSYVQVGSFGSQFNIQTHFDLSSGEEKRLVSFCGNPIMQVNASNGFANVRQVEDLSCTNGETSGKAVFYRSNSGFVGDDQVAIYSSQTRPTFLTMSVVVPEEPKVAAAPPDVEITDPGMPDKSIEPQATQKSLEALLAEGKAMSPDMQANTDREGTPPKVSAANTEIKGLPPVVLSDPEGDVRGQCRMESCTFFKVQASQKVGATGNGQLYKADLFTWDATYPDGQYDKAPKKVGERSVDQTYFFCSKSRPTAFYRRENQWFSRDLRPGDKSDVTNASYDRYVEYYTVCHHTVVEDPYTVATIGDWGYAFPPSNAVILEKKVSDPTDMLK